MPKAIVYVRAEDARTIEAIEQKEIADWVREKVAEAVEKFKEDKRKAYEEGRL